VVLLTAVAALAVAAVALLGPLEHSLRKAEVQTLTRNLRNAKGTFQRLPLCTLVTDAHHEQALLGRAESRLAGSVGGPVFVLGNAGRDGVGARLLPSSGGSDVAAAPSRDRFADAAVAFRTQRSHSSVASIGGTEFARRVIPFTKACPVPGGPDIRIPYVLAVRKNIAEIPAVARVVRRAFFDAALAALALTLLLGIPLSFRLVRRLRRLREVAIEVEHDAPMVVPVDTANDEVGDLARALAAMQQRLGQQEEARRAFVATASHELRTPLTSLEGMLELLGESLGDAEPDMEDTRELLDRARAQSRRLGRLAADLLDLSRIDAQVQLRSEPVELGELSRAVLAEFELGTEEREIGLVLAGRDGEAVWALGDPGSIARILRILLDNAVRASPPGSSITVAPALEGGARISVSDEGPGVREEERDAIFTRFSRGRDTAGQAGFGLGLAIGRELAERMGGELVLGGRAGSDRPGATFTLRLPATRAPEGDPVAVR
jgi:signal transduction histidine kinase